MLAPSTLSQRTFRVPLLPPHRRSSIIQTCRERASAMPTRPRRTAARCTAVLSAEALVTGAEQLLAWAGPVAAKITPMMAFHSSTGLMVVTYPLMMFFAGSRLTRAWVRAPLIPTFFALLHLVLLLKLVAYGPLHDMCTGVVHPSNLLPSIPHLAALFHSHLFTATSWLHLLLFDFLQARYVWADGLNHMIPTAHSLLLCFMAGPLGLLSHLGTKALVLKSRGLPVH